MHSIQDIWNKIVAYQGQEFRQIRGKAFTYSIRGNMIVLHTTNRQIPKSDVAKALPLLPLTSTVALQSRQAPSYLYALLTDERIVGHLR